MKDLSLGFIALFRQFLKWEWFTDVNTCHFMIYCLLRANKKTETWRGQKIKRGQFISSLSNMSKETGLSPMQIRTCINKLTKTGEITNEPTNQNRVITIKNYNEYQSNNKRITNVLTNDLTSENKRYNRASPQPITNDLTSNLTTNNNIYKDNNSIYNISLSNKEKITKDEREILKNYFLSKKRKTPIDDIDAYLSLIIKNGDIQINLEKAKKWQERQAQKKLQAENIPPEKIEKSSPEEEQRGLELLRNTVKKIKAKNRTLK